MISFMDVYSMYNQIKMDSIDASKTRFMLNHGNYYYNVMNFRIKKVGAPIRGSWTRCSSYI